MFTWASFRVYRLYLYQFYGERGRDGQNVPCPVSPDGDDIWSVKVPAGTKITPFVSPNG